MYEEIKKMVTVHKEANEEGRTNDKKMKTFNLLTKGIDSMTMSTASICNCLQQANEVYNTTGDKRETFCIIFSN